MYESQKDKDSQELIFKLNHGFFNFLSVYSYNTLVYSEIHQILGVFD